MILSIKFNESFISFIHAYVIIFIHQVLWAESQMSVNSERAWWQRERVPRKGTDLSSFIKTPSNIPADWTVYSPLLMHLHLLSFFFLSFCHMMKSCLDEECMRHGGSWLAFEKTKNRKWELSAHSRSCFSTVCVCGCHMHGNQCIFACRLLVDLCFIFCRHLHCRWFLKVTSLLNKNIIAIVTPKWKS